MAVKKNIFQLSSRQAGFTLLEMLLALSVLSVGVMAAFTLSTANLNTVKANGQRILAANLAREGVEVIRNIRDSNWLKIQANADCGGTLCTWDQNLDQGTSTIAYDKIDLGTNIPAGKTIEDCFADTTCMILEKNDTGYHIYTESGDPTNMARIIILKAICQDSDDTGDLEISSDLTCGAIYEEKIGLQVTSQVYWHDFSKTHTIEVVEELYNWREYEN